MIEYKKASLAELKDLIRIFADAFDEQETYQSNIPSDEYSLSLIDDPTFIPVVVIVDGIVVGGLAAYVLKKFEQVRSEIYIYDLAVDENYRRHGIATGCINKLREIAREVGSYVIYVQADHGDEPAIKLYESLGTKEDVHHFDIMP